MQLFTVSFLATTLVNETNHALVAGDGIRLLKLLRHPAFDLGAMVDDYPEYYLWLLQRAITEKVS